MNTLNRILEMISYRENTDREGFILREYKEDQISEQADDSGPEDTETTDKPRAGRRKFVKPRRPGEKNQEGPDKKADPDELDGHSLKESQTSASLKENRQAIKKLYHLPHNDDIIVRDFYLGMDRDYEGLAIFVDGLTNSTIQDILFQSLMLLAIPPETERDKLTQTVMKSLLPGNQVQLISTYKDALAAINMGDTVLFFDGCDKALGVETKGWEHRTVDVPITEQVIRGPQEAFTETLLTNTALLRKIIKNENLTAEYLSVGERSRTQIAVMYQRNLANPTLVEEVKRRIKSIKTDYVFDSGVLEQFIDDHPYNLHPTALATERPDRAASKILEGRVVIIVDGSPFVLTVPSTMYEQMQTGEELSVRWQFGTFIRWMRKLSFLLSLLLPGLYLAVVLYHQEMIPTELVLAIAGNREKVPFPSIIEVLLMEVSFELIREAGLRIPGVMGSTIGIVGALILGQAAVQANIVSPILVIIVAITGLASFAIPYFSLAFTLRIYRFIYIALGAALGFFGIAIGLIVQVLLASNLKSFGVPYLAPGGPKTDDWTDIVSVAPVFFQERRPDYVNPLDMTRQPKISRGWIRDGDNKDD